jgi:hypothetical protein
MTINHDETFILETKKTLSNGHNSRGALHVTWNLQMDNLSIRKDLSSPTTRTVVKAPIELGNTVE